MDEMPLSIGDRVQVTHGTFAGFVAYIDTLSSESAEIRIVVFGIASGPFTVPLGWLRRAKPNELFGPDASPGAM